MADFRIDRLKFNWKGNWDRSTTYKKDDVIYYGGNVYVCLQEHTSTSNFYNDLVASNTTKIIPVTVSTDNLYSQSHGVFYLDSVENPHLRLLSGKKYVFNQDDLSNKQFNSETHPLLFSTFKDGTKAGGTLYDVNVKYYIENIEVTQEDYISNFETSNFRKVEITVPVSDSGLVELYYFSPNNAGMGNLLSFSYSSNWELMIEGYEWKGDWTKDTRYNVYDLVKYNGYIYQCVSEHTSVADTNDTLLDDIINWEVFVKGYNWRNTWQADTYYNIGDVIRYNGIVYIANTSHISNNDATLGLEADQSKWTIVSKSDNWLTDWTIETRYIADDLVKYGGRIYRATNGHTSSDSLTLGLEADSDKWEVVVDGIEYKGDWGPSVRYKTGDVVKSSHSLWKARAGHTSTTSLRLDISNWDLYILGLGFENIYDLNTEYKTGDIVQYGGYTYVALENSSGIIPSVNGKLQDTGAWELVTATYSHKGEWDTSTNYKTGEVVRAHGYLYIAIDDNINVNPDSDANKWQLLVSGSSWKSEWSDNTDYSLGDVVTYRGTAYICIQRHLASSSDSRPDLDLENQTDNYWTILIQGTPTNILAELGDLKIVDNASNTASLAIGTVGKVLKSDGIQVNWSDYDIVPNVYYVSTEGVDDPSAGKSLSSPFASVAYACSYILEDESNRTPATIFIKTGVYNEILPIRVPKDTALVGDELRSTVIQPAPNYVTENMFYVRNGSGIRNMTLQGLTGTLGEPNEYLTRRPTAGAYVSLDPGSGPTDDTVWITTKSCYVQNVTTFGTGCVGMKIDGSLHNGGNKSIVANDFTQVISDGIGYWATDGGRSELVSVFTYYCHIGYLAEHGGILRATNGNNSYGTYGSVAEGYDNTEVPINGSVNNRDNEALVNEVITFGTTDLQVLALGYGHAGQHYTSASVSFGGSGRNAAGSYTEFRNGAVSNIRLVDPGDSSIPGGFGYQFIANSAQEGSDQSITIAASDIGTAAQYVGMRIVIQSGKGVGQYAEIAGFDEVSKVVIPSRESDGSLGWEHFNPGWPIETVLDETTNYSIEPKVTVDEIPFVAANYSTGLSNNSWTYIATNNADTLVAAPSSLAQTHAYSTNGGTSWTAYPSPLRSDNDCTGIVWTGSEFIISGTNYYFVSQSGSPASWTQGGPHPASATSVATDGNGNVVFPLASGAVRYSSDHGANTALATGGVSGKAAYGLGKFIIVSNTGDVAYSTDGGANWTLTSSAVSVRSWNDVVFGNGRFVAISTTGNIVARSFDGINWVESSIESEQTLNRVSYGAGTFTASGGDTAIALSAGADVWRTVDSGSTAFSTTGIGVWTGSVYHNGNRILLKSNDSSWNTLTFGTRPVVRAKVSNTRISSLLVYDPGENYSTAPDVTIFDTQNTAEAVFTTFVHDGVLAQPEMTNRGEGYVSATATITGNGYAEIYQTGALLKVTNLSNLPSVGANLEINGINDRRYSVAQVNDATGTGPYTATLTITPTLGNAESPDHLTSFEIRERYSQIRLTGHDFLDIGTGNITSTRYPDLYLEGEDAENARQPFNETVASGGGRVFYTSTDQDGNFRVGELFQVEQARGVVTISASQFNLSGLTELSLGGIQVGGSAVVIREFSKDGTFIANSNNIVPTQKAIQTYVESRISGGGSNAATNTLIAGQIQITGTTISTVSGLPINITPLVNMTGGFTGSLLAQQYMILGVNTQFE